MSAPTIEPKSELHQLRALHFYEYFTLPYNGSEQVFLLTPENDENFHLRLGTEGVPLHVYHPTRPGFMRVRSGVVIVGKRMLGHRLGYDLPADVVIAYDEYGNICWQSTRIVDIARVIEQP